MTVTRERLFEEVWAEPMTAVARRYGVSSNYLAHVCERLNVPRPGRGYWARLVGVGKPSARPGLPPAGPADEQEWSRAGDNSQLNAHAPSGRGGAICGPARNSPDHALTPNESRDEAKHARTAAIYLRVSTDTQTTDNQEPDCLRLGKSQGWEVVEVYREQESAVKRRPIFSRMMAEARNGRFRSLIVWRLDRFGRSMQGNINDVLELERAGVSVVSVKEPWLAVEGSARNLLLAIFSWLAEEERRVLVERVKAAMARARAEGKRCGKGPVPTEKVTAAAASVREGLSIRTAAREQGIGYRPVRRLLAFAAADGVREGASIRAMSRKYRIGVDTIRRVMAGTSYLCRDSSKSPARIEQDDRAMYLPFGQAREVARGLAIRTKKEWIAWCMSDGYRATIPMQPWEFYRDEWQSWSDWLGFAIETRFPFSQARAFAHGLGFKSPDEWYQWCKEGERPPTIPRDPRSAYPGNFMGFPDWLGYPPRDCRGRMMPFAVAREYAHRLALRSAKEWYVWAASEKRVRTIACNPQETYASQWVGWRDWLGHERQEMLPFRVARKQVRRLGLRSRSEWIAWTKSLERPLNIPCKPEDTYAFYWRGVPDWLGYKPVKWLPFYRARRQVRRLGLRSCAEWWAWVKTDQRPKNLPSAPQNVYRPYWSGWRDWLGYGPRTNAP